MARERIGERVSIPTFREMAEESVEMRKPTWGRDHDKQWRQLLGEQVYPFVGDKEVYEIPAADVTEVVERIWNEKPETARRILQRMATIFDLAVANEWRNYNPVGRAVQQSCRHLNPDPPKG